MSDERHTPPPFTGEVVSSVARNRRGASRTPPSVSRFALDSSPVNGGARKKRVTLTAAIAAGVVAGMTGLAFAAVPLYDAFCKLTGYGGTTQEAVAAPSQILDRRIEVRFDANIAPGLPIEFEPKQISERLRIGETGLAFYRVRNLSDEPVVARATYNVTPHLAGQYFAKLECFCFQDRTLAPGEEAELPVVFFVDPELVSDPDTAEIGTLTLSYTFFRSVDAAGTGPAG